MTSALTSFWRSEILIGLIVLAGLALAYQKLTVAVARRKFKKENNCQPIKNRVPVKDPILSLDHVFRVVKAAKEKRLLEDIKKRFQTHGPTMFVRSLGTPIISTMDPENIKTVLSLKFKDFGLAASRVEMRDLMGTGIFTTDGERWASSRHMVRPNFVRDQVADLAMFERHIQDMLKKIPKDGSVVDLQALFFQITIDSATEFLFGESVNTLRYGDVAFADAFNYAQHDIARRGRLKFLAKRDPKATEANRICHEYVDAFVDNAVRYRETHAPGEKKSKDEKYVFLHELAKSTDDKRRLRDELLNILLAGRDTTASLLGNMFFMIAKQPRIYDKLRKEIAQLEGQLPNYEQLRNLKYLKHCMNESLRLHPVVPLNGRTSICDTCIPRGGGPDGLDPVFVPKGTIINYSTYAMHRRKDFYGEDADEFRPERWETLRPGWEYLPFNGGPRICPGQQYALTEAAYVTLRILQEFKAIESRDTGPWVENLSLTLCSEYGTMVSLTPDETRG